MAQVKLNIKELKDLLRHTVENNRYLQSNGQTPLAINLEGIAGIGKTSAVNQLASELNLKLVRLCLAEIEEIGDITGFPIRQFQLCKEIPGDTIIERKVKKMIPVTKTIQVPVEYVIEQKKKQVLEGGKFVTQFVEVRVPVQGQFKTEEVTEMQEVEETITETVNNSSECLWIDEHAIDSYTKLGYQFTGQKRMSYCPPEWIADIEKGIVLLLDDYTRGDARFMQACMQLIDKQEYISWKLPEDSHIILTTNPDTDYQVTSLDTAQKTRFSTVEVKFDIDCWLEYAESQRIDGRCINFLGLHPELVTEKCNPRAITNFFNSISSIKNFESQLPMIQNLGEGAVGQEMSVMFVMFINNKLDKLITPQKLLFGEKEESIIKEFVDCTHDINGYRPDIASILTTRMINHALLFTESNTVSDELLKRVIRLSTDKDILADDLRYVFVKKLVNGNKQKWQKLTANAVVNKMLMR